MSLTTFLQYKFKQHCPPGWRAFSEVPLLSPSIEQLLGFSPRADVLMESLDRTSRYWIEFEISRADPVANHAKFATAHLFQPQLETDVFFSMITSHVTRGRHNLAANTVFLMRRIGMRAFQTVLLPYTSPLEIKRLNHLSSEMLAHENLNLEPEISRIFSIATQTREMHQHRINFVTNYSDVMLNIFRWNNEMHVQDLRMRWGKRTVTYFVFYPQAGLFAPSKFCAYVPSDILKLGMDINLYAKLAEEETRFDGTIARKHLVNTLGMIEKKPLEVPLVNRLFQKWIATFPDAINLHPKGYSFILPPVWYI